MYEYMSKLHESIYDNLESIYSDIAIDLYLDDENDFSFSIPVLSFNIKHKDIDSGELETASLDIIIEVVFKPYRDGLKVSHRLLLKNSTANNWLEFNKFVEPQNHNLIL